MVRGKGNTATREILTPEEKQGLLDEKRELEGQLANKQNRVGVGTIADNIDEGAIKRQIAKIDNAIAEREPPKLKGVEKDAMAKEAEDLERELAEGIPTRDEMNHPAKNPQAVRKHLRWLENNKHRIERYRFIQRSLNPHDPKSIEQLRRDK